MIPPRVWSGIKHTYTNLTFLISFSFSVSSSFSFSVSFSFSFSVSFSFSFSVSFSFNSLLLGL